MKYKIGDKVRIRKDLVPGSEYGGVTYLSGMDEFKDREGVITNMDDVSYQIGDFWWTDEMLEPVDDLLEYALEKLGMTENELRDEMDREEEDIMFIKKCIKNENEINEYCKKINSACDYCKVGRFKEKYKEYGRISCDDVYKYLKEKGEI